MVIHYLKLKNCLWINVQLKIFFNISLCICLLQCFAVLGIFFKFWFRHIYWFKKWNRYLIKIENINQICWYMNLVKEDAMLESFPSCASAHHFLFRNFFFFFFFLDYLGLVKWWQCVTVITPSLGRWENHETPDWLIIKCLTISNNTGNI